MPLRDLVHYLNCTSFHPTNTILAQTLLANSIHISPCNNITVHRRRN
jgi:hypothetical protein